MSKYLWCQNILGGKYGKHKNVCVCVFRNFAGWNVHTLLFCKGSPNDLMASCTVLPLSHVLWELWGVGLGSTWVTGITLVSGMGCRLNLSPSSLVHTWSNPEILALWLGERWAKQKYGILPAKVHSRAGPSPFFPSPGRRQCEAAPSRDLSTWRAAHEHLLSWVWSCSS